MAFIRWATVVALIGILFTAGTITVAELLHGSGLGFLLALAVTAAAWRGITWFREHYPE